MVIWQDDLNGVGTPHKIKKQMLLHITPHITQNWGGDTAHEIVVRCSNLGGDTAQNSKTEGGTPHKRIEQMKKTGGGHRTSAAGGRPGGWVAGWVVYQSNNATLWLHLASWNLPDSQLS